MCSLQGKNLISKGHGCYIYKEENSCITLQKSLCAHIFFLKNVESFRAPNLLYLSNMPTSFCDKVPVPALNNKTECEG